MKEKDAMKRVVCFALALLLLGHGRAWAETPESALKLSAPSAVLMEKETGAVLYEKNAREPGFPASITKIMTMLLIIEAMESGALGEDDVVTASERAASFGGSCVYLEAGEQMSVRDMLKCIAVVSANDCAVAMAEHLCGTEEVFVQKMNERAKELGMQNTHFSNCTGLFDDGEHFTTAYDVALMSRELIRHEAVKAYTTIWMDSIRGGSFELSNTNKLVYWYPGCTGLKTRYTSTALFCLSATAERDGAEYIAVVMHAETPTHATGTRRPCSITPLPITVCCRWRRRGCRSVCPWSWGRGTRCPCRGQVPGSWWFPGAESRNTPCACCPRLPPRCVRGIGWAR